MNSKLKITILAENSVEKRNLIAEHGLSFYMNYKGKKYLFDTGQGLAIFQNSKEMNINLKKLDAVILSHGHDDHSGGLRKLLKINNKLKVISHTKTFLDKYKIEDGKKIFIGSDLKEDGIDNLVMTKGKMEIDRGLFVTGEVKTQNDDYINEKYIIEENGQEKIDDFADDMS
ncbi:MAG: MBL fold metallo-hydrolase, partial [Bacillota bacterium]